MSVPNPPWRKGFTKDYVHFVVEVHVAQDNQNQVFSYHKLQHEQDEETVNRMRHQGLEEMVFAFLNETLRKESLLETLVLVSNNEDFAQRLQSARSEADMDELAQEVAHATQDVLAKAIEKQAPAAALEALQVIKSGLEDDHSSS